MALRARRPGATAGANTEVQQPETQTAPPQAEVQTPPPAAPPAQRTQAAPPAVTGNAIADLNAGILENIEDLTGGGNYVTIDGESFLYKDSNETSSEIEIIVKAGKRFYQYVDESDPDNKVFHNSDTKLDNRYKLKFEIKWDEEVDGDVKEYTMSLSTTSAIQFINYVQGLAKQGIGVGQVVTKMTISRQKRQGSNDRYSRAEFENLGSAFED